MGMPHQIHVVCGHTEQPAAARAPHQVQKHAVPRQAALQIAQVLQVETGKDCGLAGGNGNTMDNDRDTGTTCEQ